jgi:membrane AbrB-like protein
VRRALDWAALGAAVLVGGYAGDRVGVPSAYLFAAILAGLVVALRAPARLKLPHTAFRAAQAVTGVALGVYVQSSTFTELGTRWAPVAVVSLATLLVSVGAGLAVARVGGIDRTTGALGMVAGGASGIVAMTQDLGGDDRLVAFMQYLRVLLIVLATPLLVAVFFGGAGTAEDPLGGGPLLGDPVDWALTAVVAVAGVVAGQRLRLPAGMLLGPLLLAAVLAVTDFPEPFAVPPLLREVAFALIGLQVGLRFERDTLRRISRLAVPVVGAIVVLVVVSFGLAVLLSEWTGVTLLDAYLATTPGGLYAVLAIAFGSGADTTFVLAVQVLRVLVMVLIAPVVVRLLTRLPYPLATSGKQN